MARAKTGSTQDITPMPFPGESPTIALAMAAGRKYAPDPDAGEKPARAGPKRRSSAKKAAKPAARKPAKPGTRKPAKRGAKKG